MIILKIILKNIYYFNIFLNKKYILKNNYNHIIFKKSLLLFFFQAPKHNPSDLAESLGV